MRAIPAFVLFCLGGAGAAVLAPQNAAEDLYKLPAKLMIGAGLSSSQSEGAWDTDGKSESVLDHLAHLKPSPFPATIDVAADHYHRYKEDLGLAKQMKFTSHRFSISWCRIFPEGNFSKPNPEGVKFYNAYIDEVKKNGMEPMVRTKSFRRVIQEAEEGIYDT
ncbi:beta-glucosidase A-like [Frankliniella occidentalis]|uniref:Beta-glucosidase A-like n=1 Tax=Frankliniella occidentalis TaxID=133901 RepID=A0A9C6X6R8_FRAOC|nr:beta-glucosidase A-like [Frankliniella occidentalis]